MGCERATEQRFWPELSIDVLREVAPGMEFLWNFRISSPETAQLINRCRYTIAGSFSNAIFAGNFRQKFFAFVGDKEEEQNRRLISEIRKKSEINAATQRAQTARHRGRETSRRSKFESEPWMDKMNTDKGQIRSSKSEIQTNPKVGLAL